MKTLKELSQELKEGKAFTPQELSIFRLELSGWFGTLSEELQEILRDKPQEWLELRKSVKSNAEADKLWEASEGGKREMELRWSLRVCEKIMSSLRIRLEVIEKEVMNLF